MTNEYRANRALVALTLFLLVGGIIAAFPLDQLWIGIAMFVIGLFIIMLKVTWSIAGWADLTVQRWSAKNLAPKDGIDVTFRIEEERDEK
jgi:hypothetical protein